MVAIQEGDEVVFTTSCGAFEPGQVGIAERVWTIESGMLKGEMVVRVSCKPDVGVMRVVPIDVLALSSRGVENGEEAYKIAG